MALGKLSSLGIGSNVLNYDTIEKLRKADEGTQVAPIDKKIEQNVEKQTQLVDLMSGVREMKSHTSKLGDYSTYLGRSHNVIGDAVKATIGDGVPIQDMLEIRRMLKDSHTVLIGPNTPGIITPGEARLGIFPENIHNPGNIGIVSRSSTLTYEAVLETKRAKEGQSTVIGLGDDVLIGMDFIDVLSAFHEDDKTKAVVMIGQLGGAFEEVAATWYKKLPHKKPVIAFIAGDAIPFGHKMGYAGEVIADGKTSVIDKRNAMLDAGMIVVDEINQIHQVLLDILS